MARTAEMHYEGKGALDLLTGVAVTRYGFGIPLERLKLIEAGHPVPDEMSVFGAGEAIDLARAAGPDDLVLFLISGGASALCAAPAGRITLAEKQEVTKAPVKGGARIRGLNCRRKNAARL